MRPSFRPVVTGVGSDRSTTEVSKVRVASGWVRPSDGRSTGEVEVFAVRRRLSRRSVFPVVGNSDE